jgi:hypothetical protein
VLDHRVTGEGFRDLDEVYFQEFLDSHPADLTEEGFEQLTMLGESGDKEYSDTYGEASSDCQCYEERPHVADYLSIIFLKSTI